MTNPYFLPAEIDGSPARVEARDAYEDLWDSINAKRGHGWAANPWVWVVEFKVLTGGPKS